METRYLSLLMNPGLFWSSEGLLPGWSLGETVTDWAELPAGLPVVLLNNSLPIAGGRVDCVMDDGSAVWIRDETWSRRLIHRSDGCRIRVAVCRPPSSHTKNQSTTLPPSTSIRPGATAGKIARDHGTNGGPSYPTHTRRVAK